MTAGYHHRGWGAFKESSGRYIVAECDEKGERDPFSEKETFAYGSWENARQKVDQLSEPVEVPSTDAYARERDKVFTPEGVRVLLDIRTKAACLIRDAGAFESSRVIIDETWLTLNCLDVLEEYGHVVCLNKAEAMGQHRIYAEGRRMSEL